MILILIYLHLTLDIVGVKGYVDRPGLISPDTIFWALFTVILTLHFFLPYIRLVLALFFCLYVLGFWVFHWKMFFFGASEQKITGYNRFFKNTHRLLPQSEARVVPDTYHMVHTVLVLSSFTVLIVNLFRLGL